MFDNFFKVDNSKEYAISGLTKELNCIYIYNSFVKNSKNILVVTNTLYEANDIYQRLLNYTQNVLFFPMDDFIPSEALVISPEFKSERISTLNMLVSSKKNIVVTNLMGALRYLPQKKVWEESLLKLKDGQIISHDEIVEKLIYLGYERDTIVTETGKIGIRGYIIDIFPIGEDNPIRIEFWGDQIESIKYFDIETQLSIKNIDSIDIYPFTEFLTKKDIEIEKKQKYLVNYEKTAGIWEYLNKEICFFYDYFQLKKSYELLRETIYEYDLSIKSNVKTNYMHNFEDIDCNNNIYILDFDNKIADIKLNRYISYSVENYNNDFNQLKIQLDKYLKEKKTIVLCLKNRNTAKRVASYLERDDIVLCSNNNIIDNKINIVNLDVTNGFVYDNMIFIGENDLFTKKNEIKTYKSKYKMGTKIENIDKIEKGDYVIHEMFGIGIYQELATISKNGIKKDYLKLLYANNDILYVPIENINRISKYSSKDGVNIKLSKLNNDDWRNKKKKVKDQLDNIAGELLKISIERETTKGYPFSQDDESQIMFDNEFMYTETDDQLIAIDKIKTEMQKAHPMDMLLCGDVGYGKTEVAFRAMFKAVNDGKQVAYLCPTTILSNQQYNSAKDRFINFPINIALLNRFVDKKKQLKVIEDLKDGKIDIIFGTHRMLSDDVKFRDLGLLVIDEEQRFGVKHKEKIKQYKSNIDVLTLSATPIPRTLQMSITGVRSLALIETPPENRYPIQTYVIEESDVIIKEAIYKELSREGQVFLLYNNVEKIEQKVMEINRLVPEAKITFAHGKMTKDELENKMNDFINKEYDILICTTIIETGIDITNVNTLIIIDADRFGLSQLYQIRGRIGRSNKIGYAYLMYNKHKILGEIAVKRLETIKEFTKLGSGFKIAMRDLSIRGAGDILGKEQSGYIEAIGIDLYLKLLSESVNKVKLDNYNDNEENINLTPLIEVNTSIDDEYVSDEKLKIEIHQKINSIDSFEKFNQIKDELIDRFGKINKNMLIYMYSEWFEKLANSMNITEIKHQNNIIDIELPQEITTKINPEKLFEETYNISKNFKLSYKNNKIHLIYNNIEDNEKYLIFLINILNKIKENKI